MNIGMLWYDNDTKKPFIDRVRRAAEFYAGKYGRQANVCFVHPSMLTVGTSTSVDSVELRSSDSILPNHFWLGVDNPAQSG